MSQPPNGKPTPMFCMDWYRKVQNGQPTSWIACGCGDDSVRVWSSEDQPPKILRFPETSKNVVVDVSFSPNGKHLAAVDQKGFLVVWSDWVKVFSDQMFQKDALYKSLAWNTSSTKLAVANLSQEVFVFQSCLANNRLNRSIFR